MSNHSYNAGYHRGLNTEYHDVPINILFTKWIADVRRPASEALDIVAFEKGFNDGVDDYEESMRAIKTKQQLQQVGRNNERNT